MVKGMGKRGYHRNDMDKLNKTALAIGGVTAVITLGIVLFSFLIK